jgi:hypothetical protein
MSFRVRVNGKDYIGIKRNGVIITELQVVTYTSSRDGSNGHILPIGKPSLGEEYKGQKVRLLIEKVTD